MPVGDINMVVLGMGVIWREFGDGVSKSERYLRMCIGVLPVFGALFGIVGLTKFSGSSGGVRVTSVLTEQNSDFVSSSNTFSVRRIISDIKLDVQCEVHSKVWDFLLE